MIFTSVRLFPTSSANCSFFDFVEALKVHEKLDKLLIENSRITYSFGQKTWQMCSRILVFLRGNSPANQCRVLVIALIEATYPVCFL